MNVAAVTLRAQNGRRGIRRGGTHRREVWWRWFKRLVVPALLLLAVYLLLSTMQALQWADIRHALLRYRPFEIALAALLALLSYALASTYESLAKAHERHHLPRFSCAAIGVVCYATAANLSALLGNWALRYRLYGQREIGFRQTTRIALFVIGSNWSGFLLLAGAVFAFAPPVLPAHWPLHQGLLRVIGAVLLCMALAYLLLCQQKAGRSASLRGIRFTVPTLRIALLQLTVSALVWTGMVLTVAQLLPGQLPFVTVMGVQFASAVGTLLIRVPAGVGVAEVVYVALLGPLLGAPVVIAALLTFRALFQLLPLLLASLVYLALELSGRRLKAKRVTSYSAAS